MRRLESEIRIDVRLQPATAREALLEEARAGLLATPKELSPRWFYDDAGSALFEEITRLEEYYPTRREREILLARAEELVAASGADSLVELGSGTSEKTRVLLDAFFAAGSLRRFCPFDVSEGTLREAAQSIAARYPGIEVHGVVGDFAQHLEALPREGRRMIAFLGGTIGNFKPEFCRRFLETLARGMNDGDTFLLGTDLLKDRARLHAAYNDAAGVTARFNKNVLAVLNRELGAAFDPDTFEHEARFDEEAQWIEMLLRSRIDQDIAIPALGTRVSFRAGEAMRTEVSTKFTKARVESLLASAGLSPVSWFTDAAGDFALSLWRKR